MQRVFVSYSRNNLDVVKQLIEDLQAVGIHAWHDQTLSGGQRWWESILQNIRDCDVFVFALSPESWDSEACRSELAYVQRLGKTILPVLVADGINLSLLPPPLGEIQVSDYRRCDKAAAFALMRSIVSAPAAQPLPSPLPAAPKVPVSYLSTLKERIDSAEALTAQDQIELVFELEEAVREGRSPNQLHDVVQGFRRRDDLLAKLATRLDAVSQSLATQTTAAAPGPTSPKGPATNHGQTQPTSAPGPQLEGPRTNPATRFRRFVCPPSQSGVVIEDVRRWLHSEGFDSQQLQTEDQGLLLQVKKRGSWRDFVGMATSLNIVFRNVGDTMTVEIGSGKWVDKAASGAVGMLLLWPLAITSGLGAWEQMKLPDRVLARVESRLVSH